MQRQVDFCKFEASLVYTVNSRLTRATQCQKQTNSKNKKYPKPNQNPQTKIFERGKQKKQDNVV